jgi:hypothetical protein
MPKANRVHSTSRRTASKIKNAASGVAHSEVIKQCTVYAQAIAAYKGGFYTDPTGNFDYAGAARGRMGSACLDKAQRALEKLTTLSRKKRPKSSGELFAEAKVVELLMKAATDSYPEPEETDFVQCFVKDVTRYLKQVVECERLATSSDRVGKSP